MCNIPKAGLTCNPPHKLGRMMAKSPVEWDEWKEHIAIILDFEFHKRCSGDC